MPLRKIISGGQTGADEAGLYVGKRFGLPTGGTIPKGFRTLMGPREELGVLYGLIEHESDNYVPRTYQNVRDSDGTVRLAGNFESRGEVCTLKAITRYGKPHFDVDLADPCCTADFVKWLEDAKIETLNVAGNAEQTFKGAFDRSVAYLTEALFDIGLEMILTDDDILRAFGLDPLRQIIYTSERRLVDRLTVRRIGVRRRSSIREAVATEIVAGDL